MFFVNVFKLPNVHKNFPWLKAIFRRLLHRGCFSGNFPQYLRATLSSASNTSGWLLWIELYTVILFRYYTDFFLFSGRHRTCYRSLLYNEMRKLFRTNSSDRKLCCLPLFLENCEILENRRLLWGIEKREIYWHTVSCEN